MEQEETSQFPVALAVGAVVVLLLIGGVYFLSRFAPRAGPAGEPSLPFGAAEQAYAEHIHFLNVEMTRTANFLNQEVTYVNGDLSNDGVRTILQAEVTVEFRNSLNQVILREQQRVVASNSPPLVGGLRRPFQIAFEHIPEEWDRHYPSIRVTGLLLE
jgi:hypothetical protein